MENRLYFKVSFFLYSSISFNYRNSAYLKGILCVQLLETLCLQMPRLLKNLYIHFFFLNLMSRCYIGYVIKDNIDVSTFNLP